MCKEYGEGEKHTLNQKLAVEKWNLGSRSVKSLVHKDKTRVTVLFAVLKSTSIEGKIDHCCFSPRLRAEFLKLYISDVSSGEAREHVGKLKVRLIVPPV